MVQFYTPSVFCLFLPIIHHFSLTTYHLIMLDHILNSLKSSELITEEEQIRLKNAELNAPFSVHWELKTLLYLGVVLLNVGLGYLIYQNIDSIGHVVIIALISLVCIACFVYAARLVPPFTLKALKSPTIYYDYAVLLGCLTFLILEGYLQFQYTLFGTRYGLAAFIPAVLFFPIAYYFDNRGVLSLAIVALGSWLGITITPLELLNNNEFNTETLVYTGILLAILLNLMGYLSEEKNIKKHFAFTYFNFGSHLFFIAALTGLFSFNNYLFFIPLIIGGIVFFIFYARKTTSFYFLLLAVVYGYVAFTYLIIKALSHTSADAIVYILYFVLSCPLILALIFNYKKILKNNQ